MSQLNTRESPSQESSLRRMRQTTLEMLRIIEDEDSSAEDRNRACRTIRESLSVAESSEMRGTALVPQPLPAPVRHGLPDSESRLQSQETAFWKMVQQIRKSKAITQVQLADRLGITQPAVSQMLTRQCRPQRSTIQNLASALGVEAQELWPDMEVSDLLDQVAAFHQDQSMTDFEATAIERTLKREVPNAPSVPLPKWKR